MTLTTQIRIKGDTIDCRDLFDKFSRALNCPFPIIPSEKVVDSLGTTYISNPVGVGNKALLWLYNNPDGLEEDEENEEEPLFGCTYTKVYLDTPYCCNGQDIHNQVIMAAMASFPDCDWYAQNEFDGIWHHKSAPY